MNLKIFLLTILFMASSFECHSNLISAFDRDYTLYKGRGGVETGMAYVRDLNRRIQEQVNKKDERTFSNLTRVLNYVLTTGACFGISKKAPTPEQMNDLKPSFSYIHHFAERVDETMKSYVKTNEYGLKRDKLYKVYELANEYETYDPENLEGYLRAEGVTSMLDFTQHYVVEEFQRNSLFESASEEKKNKITKQSNGVLRHIQTIAKDAPKTDFIHDPKYDKPKGWYRHSKKNEAIVRDNLGHEYYVMVTPGDGACWMHSIAQDDNEPHSARDLADRLKKLTDQERNEVCDSDPEHFMRLLENHGQRILKGKLLTEFQDIIAPLFRNSTKENKQHVLAFCKKKEVFNALVESRGTRNSGALFTAQGGTNWGNSSGGWTNALSYVLKRNIFNIACQISNVTDNLMNQIDYVSDAVFSKKNTSWSFMIKQPEGNHFSALYPVEWEEVGQKHYLKIHTKRDYFAQYAYIGTPTSEHDYDDEQRENIESGLYNQRYRMSRLFGEI